MLELAKVDSTQFAGRINEEFTIVTTAGEVSAILEEVRNLRHTRSAAVRTPFALLFRTAPQMYLPQCIYLMKNAQLGEMEIFIVQVSADAAGSLFEAIFN